MIMAGRGRRLGDIGDTSKKTVGTDINSDISSVDVTLLIKKINEIDFLNVSLNELDTIQNWFKQLSTSKEVMKEILSNLHSKALDDYNFGERMLIVFESFLHFKVDEIRVRNELLSLMQTDFDSKDVLIQSDKKRFLNAVMLLGSGYRRIKIGNKPLSFMGVALLECIEILLKGEEEEDFRVLAIQMLINGHQLSLQDKLSDKYNLLQHNLRDCLVTKNLNLKCKYWILLSLDFMSNGYRPLSEVLENFYYKNLGDSYRDLKPFINVINSSNDHSFSSSERNKSQDSISLKCETTDLSSQKKDNQKKYLSDKLSGISISSPEDGKEANNLSKNIKRDNQRWQNKEKQQSKNSKGSSLTGHDDRFEKEEDFYGVQMPRRPKTEKSKRNFIEGSSNKKD